MNKASEEAPFTLALRGPSTSSALDLVVSYADEGSESSESVWLLASGRIPVLERGTS